MKKTIQVLLIFIPLLAGFFFADNARAEVRTYFLYLGTADSGNTTQSSSGVSNLIVHGGRYKRSDSTYIIHSVDLLFDGYFTVQVSEISTSQATQGSGIDTSGITFTLRFRKSDIDTAAAWSGASTYDVPELNAITMGGNTLYQTTVEIPKTEFLRWDWITGSTPYDHVVIKLKAK